MLYKYYYKLTKMKFNLVILALVGTLSATQINQMGDGEGEGKPSPDNSRAVFEKARAEAAKTVATQQAFEAKKTADVAARNTKDTNEANALKTKVKYAANQNMMGMNNQNPKKQLWTGNDVSDVQIKEDPPKEEKKEEPKEPVTEPDALADAPKAGAPIPESVNVITAKETPGTP